MNSTAKELIKRKFSFLFNVFKKIEQFYREGLAKQRIKRLIESQKELLVNAGGGDKQGENGWLNIDIKKNCDIFWDLSKGMPFPENSVKKIYCSHFLEHLTYEEGQKFLKSCWRVLVAGGTISVCVPNARLYIDAYYQGTALNENVFLGYQPAYHHTTKIDYVNYTAYMAGQHKYMFDEENLLYILKMIGFFRVAARKFDPTLDRQDRDYESIYAEAVK